MFSKRFSEHIDSIGLKRYRISNDTGIKQATLSNYYHGKGKGNPNPAIVKILAEYLNLNFDWLYDGIGEKYINKKDQASEPKLSTTQDPQGEYKTIRNTRAQSKNAGQRKEQEDRELIISKLNNIENKLDTLINNKPSSEN